MILLRGIISSISCLLLFVARFLIGPRIPAGGRPRSSGLADRRDAPVGEVRCAINRKADVALVTYVSEVTYGEVKEVANRSSLGHDMRAD
jgi:hypothetical protein